MDTITGETLRDRNERRRKAREERVELRWPGECKTCFSVAGQPWFSVAGREVKIHASRLAETPSDRDLDRFPMPCPVCKAVVAMHCVSLYTGRRTHDHRDRPRPVRPE